MWNRVSGPWNRTQWAKNDVLIDVLIIEITARLTTKNYCMVVFSLKHDLFKYKDRPPMIGNSHDGLCTAFCLEWHSLVRRYLFIEAVPGSPTFSTLSSDLVPEGPCLSSVSRTTSRDRCRYGEGQLSPSCHFPASTRRPFLNLSQQPPAAPGQHSDKDMCNLCLEI